MSKRQKVAKSSTRRQNRFVRWLIICLCAILILAGVVVGWEASEQKELEHVQVNYSDRPTVFVSGDYSNWLTFGPMNQRLQRYGLAQAVWTVHVAKNGHATIDKHRPLGHRNPLILVLFADNHNAKREAHQLTGVMYLLRQQEHIDSVNFVGHSSGCNIIYQYLTGPAAIHRQQYPQTNKFINIATTFSKREQEAANRFPKATRVLNIAGNFANTGGDLGVSVHGDQQLGRLLQDRVKTYRSVTLNGGVSVIHYLLHQNPRVDRLIVEFLWGESS